MPPRRRAESSGPLADHVRTGRILRPPMAALVGLHLEDWFRDDLPDYLWPSLVMAECGNQAARGFIDWQRSVQDDLSDSADSRLVADCLDGRLTGLQRLSAVPGARDSIRRRATECGLLPEAVAGALAIYPQMPATWLVGEAGGRDSIESEIDLLAHAVHGVLADSHRKALIKCLMIWSAVQAGAMTMGSSLVELLRSYPDDTATRAQADTAIGAAWGARKGMVVNEDCRRRLKTRP